MFLQNTQGHVRVLGYLLDVPEGHQHEALVEFLDVCAKLARIQAVAAHFVG